MKKRESSKWVIIGGLWVGIHLLLSHVFLPLSGIREVHPFSTWKIYSQSSPERTDYLLRALRCTPSCSLSESHDLLSEMKGDYRRLYWQLQTLGTSFEGRQVDWGTHGLKRMVKTTLPQAEGCCFRLFKRKLQLQRYYHHGEEGDFSEVQGAEIAF